ncbi:MAG: putative para-aminobenzoate synthase component [Actinomycetia bacterium]|nr:putative para-aminobenzoate synthase component [Actinomycetes bacterium]
MRDELICHALDWDLSAADVLRLVRDDAHPVALLGAWAGGSDIIASSPVLTAGDPFDNAPAQGAPPGQDTALAPRAAQGAPGPRFGGGWIGYLGYGAAGRFLPLPPAPGYPRRLPASWWGYYDHVLRRDRATGQWFFEAISDGRADEIAARRAELDRRARGRRPEPLSYACGAFSQTPSADEHRNAVRRAVDYIRQGDVFQANICLRLEAAFDGDPLDAFCAAATRLDPPYAAFLRISDSAAIASLSPELFLRRTGDHVLSSPIKGTRQRPADPAAAQAARDELVASAKDGAENVMIVDLMRNDLSRVCVPGTVDVPALLRAEPHPGVWHLVSDVTGGLAPGTTDEALVAATFPPGSVTGAPKVRALEIIHELEPAPREAYTGAIGYRSPVAGLELNVAIRTFEFHESRVWLGSGGGVTARSDPNDEFQESLLKAAPLIRAIGGAVGDAPDVGPPADGGAGLRPRAAMGVFTSLRVTDGRAADLDKHLARLEASTVELYGKRLPQRLAADLVALLRAPGEATRPSGRLRVTARPVGGPLQVTIEVVPAGPPPSAVTLRPVLVPGGLGPHKWRDRRLLASLAQPPPQDQPPVQEQLLLVEANGDVLETDRGNVFAVMAAVLYTPPLDGRQLPGVTRAAVLRIAGQAGIPVQEAPLTVEDLAIADEVFVTNSGAGIGRVRSGPVIELLAAALAARPLRAEVARARGTATAPAPGRPGYWQTVSLKPPRGRGARPLVVLVDNYDSFTYNLAHLLLGEGAAVEVVRNDEVAVAEVAALRPDGIVISPGPCAPPEAGISVDVVRALGPGTPVLGVCLGHQVVAAAYGGTVIRAVGPAHGYASVISHDGSGVLAGLPARFAAARYHSLVVDAGSLPAALRVTARLDDGLIMGLRHASHPVEGLQFHPESILTVPHGQRIAGNFIGRLRERARTAGLPSSALPGRQAMVRAWMQS